MDALANGELHGLMLPIDVAHTTERADAHAVRCRSIVGASPGCSAVSFGYDQDGEPLIFLGVLPFTAEVVARVTPKFAPHRVRIYQGPRMSPLGRAPSDP